MPLRNLSEAYKKISYELFAQMQNWGLVNVLPGYTVCQGFHCNTPKAFVIWLLLVVGGLLALRTIVFLWWQHAIPVTAKLAIRPGRKIKWQDCGHPFWHGPLTWGCIMYVCSWQSEDNEKRRAAFTSKSHVSPSGGRHIGFTMLTNGRLMKPVGSHLGTHTSTNRPSWDHFVHFVFLQYSAFARRQACSQVSATSFLATITLFSCVHPDLSMA